MLRTLRFNWANNLSLVVAALSLGACDAKNTSTGAACPTGDERCACYPNKTCAEGLLCMSDVCVSDDGSASGGSDSLGAGGTSANTTSANDGGVAIATSGGNASESSGGTNGTTTEISVEIGGTSGSSATEPIVAGGSVSTGGTTPLGVGGTVASTGGAVATGGASASTLIATGGATATGGQTSAAGSTGVETPNLIKDGTFQSFSTYWNAILQEGDSGTYTRPPTAAAVCVTNTSTSDSLYYELSFTIGYPNDAVDTFVIEPGVIYTLSYTVSATNPISFEVKIGHSVSPWTEVYAVATDVLATSYKTFSHQFISETGDTSAGLAFNAVLDLYGKLCLQQVSLTKN